MKREEHVGAAIDGDPLEVSRVGNMVDKASGKRRDPASGPVRVEVWARPGSSKDGVRWDEWRHRWVISITAPAVDGKANHAILVLLSRKLGLPSGKVKWAHAGTSRSKVAEITGLTEGEIRLRLSSP